MSASITSANDRRLSRRTFLRASATAAGGLWVSLYLDFPLAAQEPGAPAQQGKTYPPDAFVDIRPDGKIVIQVNRLEFGQGVQTALPMILADELDADWSLVRSRNGSNDAAYVDPLFGIHLTGGSHSIKNSFTQYREPGARARAMLLAAAAGRWNVDV